jgi:hypothetical protein
MPHAADWPGLRGPASFDCSVVTVREARRRWTRSNLIRNCSSFRPPDMA